MAKGWLKDGPERALCSKMLSAHIKDHKMALTSTLFSIGILQIEAFGKFSLFDSFDKMALASIFFWST